MNFILAALTAASVVFALLLGRMEALSAAVLSCGQGAMETCLQLCGTVALWSGIMRVAEKSGLCEKMSGLLSPVTDRLFRGLRAKSPKAVRAITMNMTANLMGLGAAATPMALEAMTELDRINGGSERASRHMVTLTALNTASFQLLPTTVASWRALAGSDSPMDILYCVWISSAVSVTLAAGLALCIGRRKEGRHEGE